MQKNIILQIRKELQQNIDNKYKQDFFRSFKEIIKPYGIKTPIVRKISGKYFQNIRYLNKKEIFSLCEELLKSGYNEEATIAFDWAFRLKKEYKKKDFKTFESWLKKYVFNWGSCDDFCTHAFGYFISIYPEFISNIKEWTRSKNRWARRASAVIFVKSSNSYYIDNQNLNHIFDIARRLLTDKDDLVQKGYGWMLKAASYNNQRAVFDFIMKNKNEMPRTALRYAIEKMPKELKEKAMEK